MKTVAQKRASADSRLQFMKKFHLKLELNEKRARERYEWGVGEVCVIRRWAEILQSLLLFLMDANGFAIWIFSKKHIFT